MHSLHYWFFQPVLYHPQISVKDTAHQCFYSQLYTMRTERELKLCLEVHHWHITDDSTPFSSTYWSICDGVIGVAGTWRHTRANERLQQAAYSSNKFLFCRPNQHKYNRHAQPNTHSEHGPQRKQANSTIHLFLWTTKSAKFVFPWPSSTTNISTITQPIKSNKISNQSLDSYLLNHIIRIYKSRIIIL